MFLKFIYVGGNSNPGRETGYLDLIYFVFFSRGSTVVKALCYKPGDSGFDTL
jgi:hypothetical protein